MAGPIKPDDIGLAKTDAIPEFVFAAFNDIILQKFSNSTAKVLQKSVVKLITDRVAGTNEDRRREVTNEIYERGWLNVEEAYEAVGWKVTYDKPAYNESYDAYFIFSRKQR